MEAENIFAVEFQMNEYYSQSKSIIMPIDPGTATLITTGVAAATSGANMGFQGNMNRKNRRFAEKMYRQQYQDELAFWQMNNAYNHPTAQMERLRNAGLNPHLVYGNGAIGNSSSAPSAPTQAKWEGKAPQMETGIAMAGLDQYFNLEAKKAQTDNLRAINTNLAKEGTLKDLGILKKAFDLDVDYTTKDTIIQQIQANLRNTVQDTELKAQNTSLAAFSQEKVFQEIENLKANKHKTEVDTGNAVLDGKMKKLDLELWDKGVTRNDELWQRAMFRLINQFQQSPTTQKFLEDTGKWNPFYRDWNPYYRALKK